MSAPWVEWEGGSQQESLTQVFGLTCGRTAVRDMRATGVVGAGGVEAFTVVLTGDRHLVVTHHSPIAGEVRKDVVYERHRFTHCSAERLVQERLTRASLS